MIVLIISCKSNFEYTEQREPSSILINFKVILVILKFIKDYLRKSNEKFWR